MACFKVLSRYLAESVLVYFKVMFRHLTEAVMGCFRYRLDIWLKRLRYILRYCSDI